MTLKEKLCEPFDGLKLETANKLEKIVNDYVNEVAIGFYKWMGLDETEDLIYSLRNKGEIYYDPTYEELLQIYKKEKGL